MRFSNIRTYISVTIIFSVFFLFFGCNFFNEEETAEDPFPNSKTVTVFFDLDGGEGIESFTGKPGVAFPNVQEPTKAGFAFTGWDPAPPATFPEENLTCKAQWQENGGSDNNGSSQGTGGNNGENGSGTNTEPTNPGAGGGTEETPGNPEDTGNSGTTGGNDNNTEPTEPGTDDNTGTDDSGDDEEVPPENP